MPISFGSEGRSIQINVTMDIKSDASGLGDLKMLVTNLAAQLTQVQGTIMATLDDLVKDVSDESTLIDSVSTMLAGIQKQLADALAGATLPADVQAKIDAVFAAAESNKAKLTAAIASGTPAAGLPVDQPPTP